MNALEAFEIRLGSVHLKLDELQNRILAIGSKPKETTHWGRVGDMGRVELDLDEILAYLLSAE